MARISVVAAFRGGGAARPGTGDRRAVPGRACARLARAELAAAGRRRPRRDEEPGRLTAQEERIAGLAADGLTNAQIVAALYLSPKTVGHHLQRVYAKLGVSSRRELIARQQQVA